MQPPPNLHEWLKRLGGGEDGAASRQAAAESPLPPVTTPPGIETPQHPLQRITARQEAVARTLAASVFGQERSPGCS